VLQPTPVFIYNPRLVCFSKPTVDKTAKGINQPMVNKGKVSIELRQ
jgi:hypothetical protein